MTTIDLAKCPNYAVADQWAEEKYLWLLLAVLWLLNGPRLPRCYCRRLYKPSQSAVNLHGLSQLWGPQITFRSHPAASWLLDTRLIFLFATHFSQLYTVSSTPVTKFLHQDPTNQHEDKIDLWDIDSISHLGRKVLHPLAIKRRKDHFVTLSFVHPLVSSLEKQYRAELFEEDLQVCDQTINIITRNHPTKIGQPAKPKRVHLNSGTMVDNNQTD